MKARRLLVATLVLISVSCINKVTAQSNSNGVFVKGDNVVSAGVGFGGTYDYVSSGYSQSPSVALTFENATIDPGGSILMGLGGYVSYFSSTNSWTDGYTYSDKYSFEFLMARFSFHYKVRYSAKIDPYAGVTVGYAFAQHSLSTADPNYMHEGDPGYTAYTAEPMNSGAFQYGAYVGARYYFTDKLGVWAELVVMNNAYNYIGLGISFKL